MKSPTGDFSANEYSNCFPLSTAFAVLDPLLSVYSNSIFFDLSFLVYYCLCF